jgi:hypothetical protein
MKKVDLIITDDDTELAEHAEVIRALHNVTATDRSEGDLRQAQLVVACVAEKRV